MSTLLEAGFTKDLLGSMNSGVLVKYMKDQLAIGNGVVGFGKHRYSNDCVRSRPLTC